MTGKNPGIRKNQLFGFADIFNYYDENLIKKKLGKMGFTLLSEDEEPYQEADGTITRMYF